MSAPNADRLLEIGRHESVVHDQLHFLAAAYLADGSNIGERHQGVGGGFDIDHAGIFSDGALYVSRIRGIDVGEFHSEICQDLVEQTGHASVKIIAANHVVAGLVHGADGVDRRHAAGKDTRSDSAFEHRQILFQAGAGGIGNARVFVALVLAQFLLNVGGSRVDRNRYRAGFGVGILAGMNGFGGEAWLLVFGHRRMLSVFGFALAIAFSFQLRLAASGLFYNQFSDLSSRSETVSLHDGLTDS